jgi:glycerol-3-phosphate acyltransferase PlsY
MDQLWWLWIPAAYLSGSVPFALLLGLARGVDIRKHGSGNVGATNCGRVLGRKWGVACFLLDVLKGSLPVAAAGVAMGWTDGQAPGAWPWQWLSIAAAAVLGHVFPVWLRFRGGKGVATGFGVLLGVWPILTLAGVAGVVTWLAVLGVFRYVSLASIVAALALPLYAAAAGAWLGWSMQQRLPFIIVSAALAVLVAVRHRGNIRRLLAGTEPRVGGTGGGRLRGSETPG